MWNSWLLIKYALWEVGSLKGTDIFSWKKCFHSDITIHKVLLFEICWSKRCSMYFPASRRDRKSIQEKATGTLFIFLYNLVSVNCCLLALCSYFAGQHVHNSTAKWATLSASFSVYLLWVWPFSSLSLYDHIKCTASVWNIF